MVALPLAGEAPEQDERSPAIEALPGASVGPDEEGNALDLRVSADIEEHRASIAERVEIPVLVGHAPDLAGFVPPLGVLHQPAAPVVEASVRVERPAFEPTGIKAVRRPHHPLRLDPE